MMADPDLLRVVLVAPRNPLNIGAAARAMSNFGVGILRVVNAYEVAYHEARSAVNASAVLARSEQYQTLAEAIADCALVVGTASRGHRELNHPLLRLESGARLIQEALPRGPTALLFGSEKFGLSNDDISYCHWLMRIPTREEHESMNLGQAVAVCLYELIRSETEVQNRPSEARPAHGEQLHLFTDLLLEVLQQSGYVQPKTAVSTEQKIRRMVSRMNLSERDAYVWLGMLRQIRWRQNNPGG